MQFSYTALRWSLPATFRSVLWVWVCSVTHAICRNVKIFQNSSDDLFSSSLWFWVSALQHFSWRVLLLWKKEKISQEVTDLLSQTYSFLAVSCMVAFAIMMWLLQVLKATWIVVGGFFLAREQRHIWSPPVFHFPKKINTDSEFSLFDQPSTSCQFALCCRLSIWHVDAYVSRFLFWL